jgi:hypothetical protein
MLGLLEMVDYFLVTDILELRSKNLSISYDLPFLLCIHRQTMASRIKKNILSIQIHVINNICPNWLKNDERLCWHVVFGGPLLISVKR